MQTRNLFAAARVGPEEPLPAEAAALYGGRQKSRFPWPDSYHFKSCLRPLVMRYDLVLFIKMASALQAWCGGNCPARMAARMVALQRFDGASLNAIKIAGIVLLVVAGLLGLAAGGALLLRRQQGHVSHFVPSLSARGYRIRSKAIIPYHQ